MRDGVTLSSIPIKGTQIIATYINGRYSHTPAQVKARFGNLPIAWIDVNGSNTGADILDVEVGDATPHGAMIWTKAKLARHPGYPPIIYCNRSTLTPVFNAMASANLKVGRDFRLWIATLDGRTKTVRDMTGVVAVQWLNKPGYDESVVYDDGWHPGGVSVSASNTHAVTPPRAPAPAPVPVAPAPVIATRAVSPPRQTLAPLYVPTPVGTVTPGVNKPLPPNAAQASEPEFYTANPVMSVAQIPPPPPPAPPTLAERVSEHKVPLLIGGAVLGFVVLKGKVKPRA